MEKITFKLVNNEYELKEALNVRRLVFVEEQGIDEDIEYDGFDSEALHLVVKSGEQIIGTARVRFPATGEAKIERMALLKPFRRRGIGSDMMSFLSSELRMRYVSHVILHAQYTTLDFYETCGYSVTGPPFWEAGIKHVAMEKQL
ncbi:MAG TPA: GNAT family N-acetyltransferase [Dehalococcoidia bacterium]|nr:GNAT family N-acetyltransferase [Dehalococcoidia bacterium]